MDSALFKAILPQRKQFMHLCCSFTRWNSSEADSLPSVGRLLNDIGVFFFILPRVPNSAPSQSDRKSTRLNSSHGYISYAVFCLKKKKIVDSIIDGRSSCL